MSSLVWTCPDSPVAVWLVPILKQCNFSVTPCCPTASHPKDALTLSDLVLHWELMFPPPFYLLTNIRQGGFFFIFFTLRNIEEKI